MNRIQMIFGESISLKQSIVSDLQLIKRISSLADKMVETIENGGRIWFCGNGGSAADAQHLAAELSGRFLKDRKSIPAEALHVNSSYLTAVANDYSFESAYARYLEGAARQGDLLLAISTSGNSKNICLAAKKGSELGLYIAGMTGAEGGELSQQCDILINMPSDVTARIQECHIVVGHILCEIVEERIFEGNS